MGRSWLIIGIMAAALPVFTGCGSTEPATSETPQGYLASLYNPSQMSLHPDFSIFHNNDEFSVLYIRAYPAELRFNQTNEDAEYRALLSIRYELIQIEEPGFEGTVVDSAGVTYKLLGEDEGKPAFFASLNIPIPSGHKYLLKIRAKDMNRGSIGLKYLYVDKSNSYNSQNFKVISATTGFPKFMRFFLPGEEFRIQHRNPTVDSVTVNYYTMSSELPRPPITATADYTLHYTPDSSFMIALEDTAGFSLTEEGMYLIRVDKEENEGLTLFNFGGSFPEVRTPTELLEPLFYVATLAEYRDLRREPNRKLAVDNFWLKFGNSVERSRELIRIYYNRVVYSNLYFTANKEGWKTDQGMIFILFGPPSRIRMTGNGERWYYFARRRSNPIEFRFDRKPDGYSNMYLEWVKTTDSQVYWNEAVRSWRNGKVYSPGS